MLYIDDLVLLADTPLNLQAFEDFAVSFLHKGIQMLRCNRLIPLSDVYEWYARVHRVTKWVIVIKKNESA